MFNVAVTVTHNTLVLVPCFHGKNRIQRRYFSCNFVTFLFCDEFVFLSAIEKNMPRNLCISPVEVVLGSRATILCAQSSL